MLNGLVHILRSALPFPTTQRSLLQRIAELEARIAARSDDELRRDSLALRYRAQSGESLDDLLADAYALVRVAATRTLGMRHYDEQLIGGIALHQRAMAEMQTGEGKTLTATLPVYLAALTGEGVHVATANDYLAARDANLVRPVYELLGLSVSAVDAETPRPQRFDAYQCDITYGTAREFGFDFLRDRLALRTAQQSNHEHMRRLLGRAENIQTQVQRRLHFALVDEADSILIDEARTPLIIATATVTEAVARIAYPWAADIAKQFSLEQHFHRDAEQRQVTLNAAGRRLVRDLAKPAELAELPLYDLYEYAERAIRAACDFQLDRHYVIRQGELVIVDEFTGRLAEGRKWRDGLHQAIEAKEGLVVSICAGELARVSVQNFFRQYQRVAGMTGTAWPARRELRRIYRLKVMRIPTHRPSQRQQLPDAVHGTSEARWRAVVNEIRHMKQAGRPVLIGTRSIDKSEQLSKRLKEAGIDHQVLNARQPATEAEIIGLAGESACVTVATNMAGRGTDIRLAKDVAERGGLHVICTELHESARIDRQLIGRCARQGDRGSFRQFMSLEDDIVEVGFGIRAAERCRRAGQQARGELANYAEFMRKAQARVERLHYRQRRMLLYAEQERLDRQKQLGQDPYLDAAF